jgi:hypothetical protein
VATFARWRRQSRGFEVIIPGSSPIDPVSIEVVDPPAKESRARWAGIIIASALFALAHGVFWMMPPLFLLAICLGYTYERTGNLWASIVMHASFNAVSISVEYWTTVRH